MRYSTFGRRSGLRVSQLALGAATFGTAWGAGTGPDDARAILDRYLEAGGNVIDTADIYQSGESERIVGDLVRSHRDDLVLSTKYTASTGIGGLNTTGNHRKNLVRSVEASLERLGLEHIDLLWVHFHDRVTPIEEVLRTLDDLARQGKVLHAGLSNFPAWAVSWASATADAHHWTPICGVQAEYSLVERSADNDTLPMVRALGLGAMLWGPLAGGLLTGKYRTSSEGRLTDWGHGLHREDTSTTTRILDTLTDVAAAHGSTPAQIAAAWAMNRAWQPQDWLTTVVGPRTLPQLEQYLAALDVELSADEVATLDHESQPARPSPHSTGDEAHNGILGGLAANFEYRASL